MTPQTRKLVAELLAWQAAMGTTRLPNSKAGADTADAAHASERSLASRFQKLMRRRSQAVGEKASYQQLSAADVAHVNAVPGVPAVACALLLGHAGQSGGDPQAPQADAPALAPAAAPAEIQAGPQGGTWTCSSCAERVAMIFRVCPCGALRPPLPNDSPPLAEGATPAQAAAPPEHPEPDAAPPQAAAPAPAPAGPPEADTPPPKIKPAKKAFCAFKIQFRTAVQLDVYNEKKLEAELLGVQPDESSTHLKVEKRLQDMWSSITFEERKEWYVAAGVSSAGAKAGNRKRSNLEAFGNLSQNAGNRKRRANKLRSTIREASGTDGEISITLLLSALNLKEQKELLLELQRRFPENSSKGVLWQRFGRRMVELLSASAHRKFIFPFHVLAHALRSVGFGCRKRVSQSLEVLVPKRVWKESAGEQELPRFMPTKADNGRLHYRQCPPEKFRAVLEANYTESSAPLSDASRPRTDTGNDVVLRKTLLDSSRQVFIDNAKHLGIKMATWFRNKKQDHPDVCKGTSKLDACEDCTHWDNSVEPAVKAALAECKADLLTHRDSLLLGWAFSFGWCRIHKIIVSAQTVRIRVTDVK